VIQALSDALHHSDTRVFYGSTEVGPATAANPLDLHEAPGTAGRPLLGSTVEVLGDDDRPVAPGRVGRIFVASGGHFDGYTGGGTKPQVGSLMATGDLGYLDEAGRLYVGGRDDDMIVSGGENVFPREVEDLLVSSSLVADAAVMGVDDEEFGQRLVAWVVPEPGEALTADDVRQLVRSRLARHKVPRDVHFVDELPRNATGKLLRRVLARRLTPSSGEQQPS
jgi:fatty-acyl-CoA synthase